MKALDKLLADNGIKPAPKKNNVDNIANGREAFDNMFDSPIDMLDDLFNNIFPSIGKDYKKDV